MCVACLGIGHPDRAVFNHDQNTYFGSHNLGRRKEPESVAYTCFGLIVSQRYGVTKVWWDASFIWGLSRGPRTVTACVDSTSITWANTASMTPVTRRHEYHGLPWRQQWLMLAVCCELWCSSDTSRSQFIWRSVPWPTSHPVSITPSTTTSTATSTTTPYMQ